MSISATTGGILYIVATPIGNQNDITLRALNTLKTVDAILAEDTRHSMQLLTTLGIKKPFISLHAHNEANKSASIIQALLEGQSFALISDAGTPLISDPGYLLVKQAQQKGITVTPIPGACALIAALSASGMPTDIFTFYGFLPAKQNARLKVLESCRHTEHTLIFYESTHRILDCIKDLNTVFGDAFEWVLAKELTKTFERFITGNSQAIEAWLLSDSAHCKGEFVLILPPRPSAQNTDQVEDILNVLLKELPLKQAVKLTSQLTKEPKNEIYKLALARLTNV
jgi:16S rRNA (cytidine1402-2'-O)-methyltransferase